VPVAKLGAALGVAAGACAKIALDIELLAQTEVAEVREAAGGASSTMPSRSAWTLASPRVRTPSLRITFLTWLRTVSSLSTNASAICSVVRPADSSSRMREKLSGVRSS
jgi:hypothetical protein